MNRGLVGVIAVLIVLVGGAAFLLMEEDAPPAAVVEGEAIEVAEVEEQLRALEAVDAVDLDEHNVRAEVKGVVLSMLIHERLFRHVAETVDVALDDGDVPGRVAEEVEEQLSMGGAEPPEDPEERRASLGDHGVSREFVELHARVEDYEEQLRLAMADDLDYELGSVEFRNAFEELFGHPAARHILVDEESTAEDVLERLDEGASFGDLAREHSTDPSALRDGGDLSAEALDAYGAGLAAALEDADVGEVIGPVESAAGYHVVERLPRPEGEDVSDEVRLSMAEDRGEDPLMEWFEENLADVSIEVDPRFGTWSAEQGRVVVEAGAED